MLQQFFIYKNNYDIYTMSWIREECRGIVVICPPLVKRSISGIRYYVSQLATRYFNAGYTVFTANYEGLGNSGISKTFTYEMMLDSMRGLIDHIRDKYKKEIDNIVGVGAGNFAAVELGCEYDVQKVLLMNPDFSIPQKMAELVEKRESTQSCCLIDGYLETQYYRMTSNGSDATFTILDFENPDTELRFWDTICGPFFGGEEEVVSYQFVKDILEVPFFELLAKCNDVIIEYWGNKEIDERYRVSSGRLEYVGKLTNEKYWYESSVLFDETIKKAVEIFSKDDQPSKEYHLTNSEDERRESIRLGTKRECISVNIGGEQCLGILHSPLDDSDESYPLIIFEHGLGCDGIGEYGSWVRLTEKLSRLGYYCYRYDHLGSGVSGGLFEDTLYTGYAEELMENIAALHTRKELAKRKIIILSWSFGACISLLTYKQLKDIVAAYVFWSPLVVAGTATSKVKLFRDGRGGYRFPISPLWMNVNYLQQERAYDFVKLYHELEKPTLLITGVMDNPEFNSEIADDITKRNSDKYKHVEVFNTGHCFSEETIDYVISSTVGWIEHVFGKEKDS